jgi:hypothetical protein
MWQCPTVTTVDDLHLLIRTFIGEEKNSYQEALLQVVDPNIRAKHEKNPYKLCSVCITMDSPQGTDSGDVGR